MSERIRYHLDEHIDPVIAYCHVGTRSIGELVRALHLIHEVLTPEDIYGRVEYL